MISALCSNQISRFVCLISKRTKDKKEWNNRFCLVSVSVCECVCVCVFCGSHLKFRFAWIFYFPSTVAMHEYNTQLHMQWMISSRPNSGRATKIVINISSNLNKAKKSHFHWQYTSANCESIKVFGGGSSTISATATTANKRRALFERQPLSSFLRRAENKELNGIERNNEIEEEHLPLNFPFFKRMPHTRTSIGSIVISFFSDDLLSPLICVGLYQFVRFGFAIFTVENRRVRFFFIIWIEKSSHLLRACAHTFSRLTSPISGRTKRKLMISSWKCAV